MGNELSGYPCPDCGNKMRVTDSRRSKSFGLRRVRKCVCGTHFTTYETPWKPVHLESLILLRDILNQWIGEK